ncbi:hypothetical protein AB0E08_13640 [Streptomyces sp. NPDC048281]|uniref:hypothetical protein n=1 Tax=Streptomyces sp. NPDC048281 TaxID=3154715 RepID=UPI00343B5D8A
MQNEGSATDDMDNMDIRQESIPLTSTGSLPGPVVDEGMNQTTNISPRAVTFRLLPDGQLDLEASVVEMPHIPYSGEPEDWGFYYARATDFLKRNRTQVTTGIKALGQAMMLSGSLAKKFGYDDSGSIANISGNIISAATAVSDAVYCALSAVTTLRHARSSAVTADERNELYWAAYTDMGKAASQIAGLVASALAAGMPDDDVVQLTAMGVISATAMIATGKTTQEMHQHLVDGRALMFPHGDELVRNDREFQPVPVTESPSVSTAVTRTNTTAEEGSLASGSAARYLPHQTGTTNGTSQSSAGSVRSVISYHSGQRRPR